MRGAARTGLVLVSAVAVALGSAAVVPLQAQAREAPAPMLLARGGLSPDAAEAKRQAIREAVQSDRDAGNMEAVAAGLEDNGALLGDPVVILEAGEIRLGIAEEDRSIEQAERSIETTNVALDILHFYDDVASGKTRSGWRAIDPGDAASMIADAEDQIGRAESLIETIEREQAEAAGGADVAVAPKTDPGEGKHKRNPARPGTGLIVAGTAFAIIGVAGAGVAGAGLGISSAKQKEVETKQIPEQQDEVERLDAEGRRANIMGYVGVGIAAGGLALGIPLLVAGIMKRKKSKTPPATARMRVLPMLDGRQGGLVLSGSF